MRLVSLKTAVARLGAAMSYKILQKTFQISIPRNILMIFDQTGPTVTSVYSLPYNLACLYGMPF